MECNSPHQRQFGLKVASHLSVIITPDNPLSFDLNDKIDDNNNINNSNNDNNNNNSNNYDNKNKKNYKKKTKKEEYDDPDRPLFFKENSDKDYNNEEQEEKEEEEEEEEEGLPAYDLEDDESDLNKVKTPIYIRDCINGLKSQENVELFEISLQQIKIIIESKPDDLQEMSLSIIQLLLDLQINYEKEQEKYNQYKLEAMISITINATETVISYLTSKFQDDNFSLQQKIDILYVLEKSSKILSNSVQDTIVSTKERSNFKIGEEEKVGKVIKSIVHRTPKSIYRNKFINIAHQFFFPLLNRYNDSKLLLLLGTDAYLLSQLVFTLSRFIEHTGNHVNQCVSFQLILMM